MKGICRIKNASLFVLTCFLFVRFCFVGFSFSVVVHFCLIPFIFPLQRGITRKRFHETNDKAMVALSAARLISRRTLDKKNNNNTDEKQQQ